MQRTPVIVALFSTEQAWALAQFFKRVSLQDYEQLAWDLDEALLMQDAGQVLRAELARAGYPPHQGSAQPPKAAD
jgi:hypothetical protein